MKWKWHDYRYATVALIQLAAIVLLFLGLVYLIGLDWRRADRLTALEQRQRIMVELVMPWEAKEIAHVDRDVHDPAGLPALSD